ncbi:HGR099Wp [Eremothecium sinecaudum]|uniref:HGR099Wp n=1 Tax=Eremothecium sinecaudum TaxID=45286 RepID=A0A109V076_9SACH|nr:HGR099Wp [Eremothecium sinecaudum]AMD22438.1 HGR099Wp [Eremothecium sinecaudum]
MGNSVNVKVVITDTEVINKSYVIYTISVKVKLPSGITNEYKSKRRFREFLKLKRDLETEFNTEIPYEFPSKKFNLWAIKPSYFDPEIIDERKQTLGVFLGDLLNDSFDVRWKQSKTLCNFLDMPYNWYNDSDGQKAAAPLNEEDTQEMLQDVSKWLESIRDAKSQFEEAKRNGNNITIMRIRLEVRKLEKALTHIQEKRLLGEGEVNRRWIILNALKADLNKHSDVTSPSFEKQTYLGKYSDDVKSQLLGENKKPHKPAVGRRKLGETAETIGLSNKELLQLHKNRMVDQDAELESLRQIVIKQKQLSVNMNQELATQNEMLDMFVEDVNATSNKLRMANISAKRFNEKN